MRIRWGRLIAVLLLVALVTYWLHAGMKLPWGDLGLSRGAAPADRNHALAVYGITLVAALAALCLILNHERNRPS